MAAPTATARQTPVGLKLKEGQSALITFAADPDVSFWEKGVKPPGIDGGDAIETKTHHNTTYTTKAARSLKTLTDVTVTAAYDPAVYTQILALVNVETTVTIEWHDGSTVAFYGFLRTVEFSDMVEGTQPELTATITPTNADPATGAEEGPVVVSVAGT